LAFSLSNQSLNGKLEPLSFHRRFALIIFLWSIK